jgi:PEP-CTERM motif
VKTKNNAQRLSLRAATRALIAAIGLAPFAALAGTINFGLTTTNGSSSWGGSCGYSCSILEMNGSSTLSGLNGYFGPSDTPAFTFSAQVDVSDSGPLFGGILTPPAGSWSLNDGSGDSLFGSLTSWFSNPGSDSVAGFYYDVTGGTGVFNDVSGLGGSVVTFSSYRGGYSQKGAFLVDASNPVHVPEPGTLSLFGAALAALTWSVRRRRTAVRAL